MKLRLGLFLGTVTLAVLLTFGLRAAGFGPSPVVGDAGSAAAPVAVEAAPITLEAPARERIVRPRPADTERESEGSERERGDD